MKLYRYNLVDHVLNNFLTKIKKREKIFKVENKT